MTNPEGVPVDAVYGFTNMLLKMLNDYHAPYIAVIFDAARENFRNEIYPEYKANRDETPEDLIPQFPLIRKATEAFDIPAIELEGYEADDLIAAYTKRAKEMGKKVVIVSSDKDLMQLVDENVRMLDPMKGKYIGHDEVIKKFGVTPDKVVDVQALAGDSTDNIPGVPGIGVKTAAQLINDFGDLETLLNNAETIKQPKRRQTLIENADLARISRQLVLLDENAPVPIPLEDLKTHDPDKPELLNFLQEQGFKSIISRIGNDQNAAASGSAETLPDEEALPAIKNNTYILINTLETLQQFINDAYETGHLAIDTETTGLTPAKASLVGISLCARPGIAGYIPLGHSQEKDLLDSNDNDIEQLAIDKTLEMLKPVLEDPKVLKIGHNMKYDWQMIAKNGVKMTPCDDTMLISYVLDGSSHSHKMDELSSLFLDHKTIKYEDIAGKGKSQVTFDKVPIEEAINYASEDAEITLRLHKLLKPRLIQEKMVSVYEDIERPLIPVIAQMELTGIKVDPKVLKEMSTAFGKKLSDLESEIHSLAQTEFNVGSPKQVGKVLFDNLGLKGGKKTKTGEWSTNVSVLEKLASEGHEIVQRILDWRQLSKLKSTYTDALQNEINPATGRIHTSFHMTGTNTGRLASSDPNLQNIPIRTEEGRKIREAFIANEDCVLLSIDYSQVELRLAAELAGVDALKDAFKDNIDIHSLTASQVFGVPIDKVTPDLRRKAKAVNFGIIYGISQWGLAKQLNCDPTEAGDFIRRYLDTFSEIRDYMEETKSFAHNNGYVKTLYGRKCVIRSINDKNQGLKMAAERAAINAPLQGTAADIMKKAMAKIPPALEKSGLKSKMLLQVHDELIFEVPKEELEQTSDLVRYIMENIADIGIPLDAESGFGDNWSTAH
jgi:DNA polymerase-1